MKTEEAKENDLIDHVILSCVINQYIYSKARFDSSSDTASLLAAAQESHNVLLESVRYKIVPHIDELLEDRLREFTDNSVNGRVSIRLGGDEFMLIKMEKNPL